LAYCIVLAAPSVASAQARTPKAVVLNPSWGGQFSETEKTTLGGSLSASVAAQGYALVEDRMRDAMLEGDRRLRSCLDTVACKIELAEKLDADVAISAAFERTVSGKKADWVVTVAVLPVDVRRLGASDVRRCPGCSTGQVDPLVTALVGSVMSAERHHSRAKLVVRPKQPTATVLLEGKEIGRGEVRVTIYGDSQTLRIESDGRSQEIRIEEGPKTHTIDVDLEAGTNSHRDTSEGGAQPVAASGSVLRPVGIVGIIGGVLAIGGGVAMLAINGKGSCTLVPPAEHCPERYATLPLGIGLTVGGVVLAGVGALLVYLGRPVEKAPVSFAPFVSPNSAGLAAMGSF
jgi:hypothetical protein